MLGFSAERARLKSYDFVIGVDEAGRGPLAGPVVSGAFCFLQDPGEDEESWYHQINDSKQVSEVQREEIFSMMAKSRNGKCARVKTASCDTASTCSDSTAADEEERRPSFVYSYAAVDVEEIDLVNVLEATKIAMTKATEEVMGYIRSSVKLSATFKILIDGNQIPPGLPKQDCEAIVKGDGKVLSIAAASIVAKCVRDGIMRKLDAQYPEYGLAGHKGYGTKDHVSAIKTVGPSRIHRLSFEPCFGLLKQGKSEVPDGRRFDEIVEAKEAQKLKSKKRCAGQLNLKQMFGAEEAQDGTTSKRRRRRS